MENAQEILKHLFDLYGETELSEQAIINLCNKNPERYNAWKEAFENYDTVDVFNAIDEYWRYQSNKTKPTVAKILAMLHTQKEVAKVERHTQDVKYISPEGFFMQRDIALGRNANCLLSDYKRAVDYIMNDLLMNTIGYTEYSKIRYDYQSKYELAVNNNLFSQLDNLLGRI